MKRDLPSLNALRAFEAAARLESLSRAADELSVTHAAVSHQIRGLEDWLGQKLFYRQTRQIRLTEAGGELLPVLTDSLDRIAERIDRLRSEDRRQTLTISAAPSIAYRWIVPRLSRFSEEHPEIDVRLELGTGLADFDRDGVDVGLRYGRGGWKGVRQDRLMSGHAQPMASRGFLEAQGLTPDDLPLAPEQIAALPIHHEENRLAWRGWFDAAGIKDADVSRGAVFDSAGSLVNVALSGQGAILGRVALVEQELRDGLLFLISERKWLDGPSYWLVCSARRAHEPHIAAFWRYVMGEVFQDVRP